MDKILAEKNWQERWQEKVLEKKLEVWSKPVYVVFLGDDPDVFEVPREVADSEEGKRVILAITGRDPKYNPYMGVGPEIDRVYVATIDQVINLWREKYLVPLGTLNETIVVGCNYQ